MPPLDPLPDHEGFTLVHSADLHLGSGMRIARKLGRQEDLDEATYEALDNLVALVDREQAAVLTLGGDLFDEPNLLNPGPRRRLARALEQIPDTRVAVLRGNHDHHHRNAPQVDWPSNVFEFEGNRKTLHLGHVRIHGVSYSSPREPESMLGRYPDPSPDHFDIGLLHANVGGSPGHENHAPCTVQELVAKGYQMWLLGHIHKRNVLLDDPLIVYPGNLQGRDAGETGPRTAEVVQVSAAGAATTRAEPVHSVLWEGLDCDVSDCETVDAAMDRVAARLEQLRSGLGAARGAIVRVRLTGASPAHAALSRIGEDASAAEQIRDDLNHDFGQRTPFVLVERVQVGTTMRLDLRQLVGSEDIGGLLVRMAEDPAVREDILAELAAEGPGTERPLEALAGDLWDDALQAALVRLLGGDASAR